MLDNFEKSEKGKEMNENGDYSTVKKTVKTGIHVLANLYEGLSEGLTSAGVGLMKGGTKVVGAKYGEEAGEASYGVVEGAKNVAAIMKVPKNEAKRVFLEKEEEK